MKYSCEVTIALPRAQVIALFDEPANMKHWQQGFVSFEAVSGRPGHPGAKSRLRYNMGGREVEMIETITERALPDRFSGTYEAKGVFNTIDNRFEEVSPTATRWISETEFKLSGFMRVIGWLMPGAFRKQTQQFMDNFKAFAENGTSVAAKR